LNIAATVVSQQNSSLSTMDTDQLLDLFTLGNSDSTIDSKNKSQSSSNGPLGQKNFLADLEELPLSEEYDGLNVDAFTSSLK
jgi:TATA-binding protein-associated factor